MLINQIDINKHLVAFGDNSITVKSLETGKTAGVILDARRLSGKSRNARQDFDAFEKIKKAGLDSPAQFDIIYELISLGNDIEMPQSLSISDCAKVVYDYYRKITKE